MDQLRNPQFISRLGQETRQEVLEWLNPTASAYPNLTEDSVGTVVVTERLKLEDPTKLIKMYYTQSTLPQEIKDFLTNGLTLSDQIISDEMAYLEKSTFPNSDHLPSSSELLRSFKTEMILERFYLKLKNQFPDLINDPKECPWTWNSVGFIKARIRILCSHLGKDGFYGALFGTTIGQKGYSGCYKHLKHVYDIMLTGKMKSFATDPKDSVGRNYGPGDISDLVEGTKRFYEMTESDEEPYMYDMGIGSVISAFPDGIIKPALFLDYDLGSAWNQIESSFKASEKSSKCTIL